MHGAAQRLDRNPFFRMELYHMILRKLSILAVGIALSLLTVAAVINPFDNYIWGTIPEAGLHSALPVVIHHQDGDTSTFVLDTDSVSEVVAELSAVCPTCGNVSTAQWELNAWSAGAGSLPEADPVHFWINEASQ